jgi:hypothetical protein
VCLASFTLASHSLEDDGAVNGCALFRRTTITRCGAPYCVESMLYSVSHTAGRYDGPRLGGGRVGEVPYQRTMTSIASTCPAFCAAGASGALRLVAWMFFSACKTPVRHSLDASEQLPVGGRVIESFSSFQRPVFHVSCINITHVL